MENQTKNTQQANRSNAETKKTSNQPTYEDKPWDVPQYGQREEKTNETEDSCGCSGGGKEEGNKKDQSLKKDSSP